MDQELKHLLIKKIIIRSCIMILVAILIATACIIVKSKAVTASMEKLSASYMNKYTLDLKGLDFLDAREKKQYKKKFIQACEAYDLKQVTKIVIDEGSINYDGETNMYAWVTYCNDKKKTSFLCAYKKSTKVFTVERQYTYEDITIKDIENKNKQKAKDTGPKQEPSTESVKVKEGTKCKVKTITYPKDSKLLKTDKEKKTFTEMMQYWLGYENVESAEAIKFKEYNIYNEKVLENELLFDLKGSQPTKVKRFSAVYTNKDWEFAVVE